MYYRNENENYLIVDPGGEGYLYINTLYKDSPVEYNQNWGNHPFILSFKYTTGECRTRKFYKYGYFEARIKLPRFKGAHPAFWLFSGNHGEDKNALEVDIMETSVDNILDTRRYAFTNNFSEYNHKDPEIDNHQKGHLFGCENSESLSDDFHLYAVEWTYNELRYYFDNQLVYSKDIPEEYEQYECRIKLCMEVDHSNPPHPYVTEFNPMIIDYVKVYQKEDTISQRPIIDVDNGTVIKPDQWGVAKIKDADPTAEYFWEPDDNVEGNYYIDGNDWLHFKLKPGKRNAIIQLLGEKSVGPSILSRWKDQTVFTDRVPCYFELRAFTNVCNNENHIRAQFINSDYSQYGIESSFFSLY